MQIRDEFHVDRIVEQVNDVEIVMPPEPPNVQTLESERDFAVLDITRRETRFQPRVSIAEQSIEIGFELIRFDCRAIGRQFIERRENLRHFVRCRRQPTAEFFPCARRLSIQRPESLVIAEERRFVETFDLRLPEREHVFDRDVRRASDIFEREALATRRELPSRHVELETAEAFVKSAAGEDR